MPNRNIAVELPGGINTTLIQEEMDLVNALEGQDRENYIEELVAQAHQRAINMPQMNEAIIAQAEGRLFDREHWHLAVAWELVDGPHLAEDVAEGDDIRNIWDNFMPQVMNPPRPLEGGFVPEGELEDMDAELARMEAEIFDDIVEAVGPQEVAGPEPAVQFIQPEGNGMVQIDLGDGQIINVQPGRRDPFAANPNPAMNAADRARELQMMIDSQNRMDEERRALARRRVILDLPGGQVIEREPLPDGNWRFVLRSGPGGHGIEQWNIDQVRAEGLRQGIDIDVIVRQRDIERQQADVEQNLRGYTRRGFVIQNEMPVEKPVRAKRASTKKDVLKEIDGFEYGGHIWCRSLTVNEQEYVDRRGWQALIKVMPELGQVEAKEVVLNEDEEVIVSIAELADYYTMQDMAGIPGFTMDTHEKEYNESMKKHIQTISSFKRIKHG